MRFGILLILLQSMLLCAEGRAESQAMQLDSARKVTHMLLQSGGQLLQSQEIEDSDATAVAPAATQFAPADVIAPFLNPVSTPSSAARAAHTIRAPPYGQ